jgi:hypothetical protein
MLGYYFRLYDKNLPIKTILEGILPNKECTIYPYSLMTEDKIKEIDEQYSIPFITTLESIDSDNVSIEGFYIEIESEEIHKFKVRD